jgi:glycosyltransferase involved in cell wall biosynthesis
MHFLGWHLGVIEQARLSGIKTVISFHDYFALTPLWTLQGEDDPLKVVSPEYALTWFNNDISKYLIDRRAVLTESIESTNYAVVPSEFLASKLSVVFNNTFQIIPYGINPFKCVVPKNKWTNFRFGYLGALIPQKGWQSLVAGFNILQRDYPNTELHLFGGAQELPKSTERIFYHGAFDEADLSVILSMFDVAVIPSIFPETFCIVLSEIWAGQKIAAVSDIGALGSRVHDGINGKKFRAGDIQCISETLRWFLENDSWRSFEVPKPTYISECAANYDSLYKEALTS